MMAAFFASDPQEAVHARASTLTGVNFTGAEQRSTAWPA